MSKLAKKHIPKRHSEDVMRKALSILESGQARTPDDDSPEVIADTINELLKVRGILDRLTNGVGQAHQEAVQALKQMSIS